MTVQVYIGRDNVTKWQLQEDCVDIDGSTVTRVTLNIPEHGTGVCLDSDNTNADISIDNDGIVSATIGTNVSDTGFYDAYLTVYTNSEPNGIAWSKIKLQVKEWETCA